MTINLKITTEALRAYARTEDALDGFYTAVSNGQSRLALEVLVDIIDGLVEKIQELEAKISNSSEVNTNSANSTENIIEINADNKSDKKVLSKEKVEKNLPSEEEKDSKI